jgi:hypothetical protein
MQGLRTASPVEPETTAMHFGTRVDLVMMREGVARPGLAEAYKEATFSVASDGVPAFEVRIPVHPAWPDAETEKVARSFLAARLAEASAVLDAYTPAELDALWRRVRPEDSAIESRS